MKRLTLCNLALLLCCTAALCTGCWDRKDFNQLAIAQAIAVDYADGQYQLTVQLLMPNAVEDTVSSDSIWIIGGKGASVGDALEDLALRAPREIYLDHLDIVLLGEGLLQKGMEEGLEYMMQQSVLRRRTSLLAVEGLAGDVLQAKAELADVDIYYLKNLLRDQKRRVKGGETVLNDYYLTMQNGIDEGLVIPRVEVENEKAIRLQGAAVILDKALWGWVNQQWLASYHWITGGREIITLEGIGFHGGTVTVELQKESCKWELVAEEPLQVRLKLQARLFAVENAVQTERLSLEEIELGKQRLQEAVEQQALQQLQAYIAQLQQAGCDTLQLGRWLRAWHPALVDEEAWPQLFSEMNIDIQLETKVELYE